MALKIVIKPPAEEDLSNAVKWYFFENEELASTFLFEFRDAVRMVSRVPYGFEKKYKNIRAFSLKKFPYNVYYIANKNTMFINCCFASEAKSETLEKKKMN